jgi:FixJ family two-component response regulator
MKVAIVDDDERVCRAIARLLDVAGMCPCVFASAEEFLSAHPAGIDCILLDIRLGGGISGPELHRRLLDEGDRTPVIYLSASDDPSMEAAGRLLGCAAFVRKGDRPSSILSALARIQEKQTSVSTRADKSDGRSA